MSSVRPDWRVPVAATAALSLFALQIIIRCQIFVSSVRTDRTRISVTKAPNRPANNNEISENVCKCEQKMLGPSLFRQQLLIMQ